MKQSYDSTLRFLYSIGREDLIDPKIRKQIPYATRSDWRKNKGQKLIGSEYQYVGLEFVEKATLLKKIKSQKKMLNSVARSRVHLSGASKIIIERSRHDKELRMQLFNTIEELKKHFTLFRILKWFGINRHLYAEWQLEARYECTHSFTNLCLKRHPSQLQKEEINLIRKKLSDPDKEHWPVCSIAYFAMRNEEIMASLWTWYKYSRIFNLKHNAKRGQKKRVGLHASYPNEYLHADTTEFEFQPQQKIYITFITDNYSRKILGYKVGDRTAFENVKEALKCALPKIISAAKTDHTNLVTDGGTENVNKKMIEFLENLGGIKINHFIALKDILFSNSPVEAIHKIMKGRYLRGKHYASREDFEKHLDWAVGDYNNVRPHYAHEGKTPKEAFYGERLLFSFPERLKKAKADRVARNKVSECRLCADEICNNAFSMN